MKKVFVTGSTGFLGSHLVALLKQNLDLFQVHEFTGEIINNSELTASIQSFAPDVVIHLAGMSHVMECEADPGKALQVNCLGTENLVFALRKINFAGSLYFSSTAQVYKSVQKNDRVSFDHQSSIEPQNTYAFTKLLAEKTLEGYSQISSAHVTILRLFNHTHKSQSNRFFLPSVYNQILNAKDGDTIKLGNLDIYRDFSLVSDLMEFFLADLKNNSRSKFEVLNLSSGVGRNLRSLVDLFSEKLNKKVKIETDPALVRSGEPTHIIGSFSSSYKNKKSDAEFVDAFLKGV
jgi:nucleoside-diphosphate-sugar epimerase